MPTPTYSQDQREYWTKRPADILKYDAVDFYHPDFGNIRLVANQFSDKMLDGKSYQAVSMEFPQVTNQTTDTTKAGAITFGRIGTKVRQKLLSITPLGGIKHPITATLRQFQGGVVAPIYERRLFVDQNGISINADSVNVKLSVNNPSKLTNKSAFYDPSLWKGLQHS
tara:strand:+ start:529 stop:1032 length:504 start_codon:yes stop_codon:yes gene_type:complete